jgi:D-alanyl-D-alanine carboxypeptidase
VLARLAEVGLAHAHAAFRAILPMAGRSGDLALPVGGLASARVPGSLPNRSGRRQTRRPLPSVAV